MGPGRRAFPDVFLSAPPPLTRLAQAVVGSVVELPDQARVAVEGEFLNQDAVGGDDFGGDAAVVAREAGGGLLGFSPCRQAVDHLGNVG
jgi:hypothetical protein